MAKQLVIHSGIITLVVCVATFLANGGMKMWSRGENEGALKSTVVHNTEEIKRVDVEGCAPSKEVRLDLVGMKRDISSNADDVKDIKVTVEEIREDRREMLMMQRAILEEVRK